MTALHTGACTWAERALGRLTDAGKQAPRRAARHSSRRSDTLQLLGSSHRPWPVRRGRGLLRKGARMEPSCRRTWSASIRWAQRWSGPTSGPHARTPRSECWPRGLVGGTRHSNLPHPTSLGQVFAWTVDDPGCRLFQHSSGGRKTSWAPRQGAPGYGTRDEDGTQAGSTRTLSRPSIDMSSTGHAVRRNFGSERPYSLSHGSGSPARSHDRKNSSRFASQVPTEGAGGSFLMDLCGDRRRRAATAEEERCGR